MSQVTLSFQVDENVRAILADAAKVTGRDVDQLLRDLAEDYARRTIQTRFGFPMKKPWKR
jgi:hypothetical protein